MKRTINDVYRAGFVCFIFGALGVLNAQSDSFFVWWGTWGVLIIGMIILLIPEHKLPAVYGRLGEHLNVNLEVA